MNLNWLELLIHCVICVLFCLPICAFVCYWLERRRKRKSKEPWWLRRLAVPRAELPKRKTRRGKQQLSNEEVLARVSTRTANCLRRALRQPQYEGRSIADFSDKELLYLRNFGQVCLRQLHKVLGLE